MKPRHSFPAALLLVPAAWHGAYYCALPWLAPWLVTVSLAGLCLLAGGNSARKAFYGGVLAGLGIMVPHLWFFEGIFSWLAGLLWLLLAVWHGVFAATLHWVHHRFRLSWALLSAPFLWMGLEFFRSEVWTLRFAWLTTGFALPAEHMGMGFARLGVYGSGALLMAAAALLVMARRTSVRLCAGIILPAVLVFPRISPVFPESMLAVAGVQCENTSHQTLIEGLDNALAVSPETQLFVLPEYAFQGPVPEPIATWCRTHQRWLIAGGTKPVTIRENQGKPKQSTWFNTAWVVGPDGGTRHDQAKSMPIQFFHDGMPAEVRQAWDSPWGMTGICICNDQNYRRVTDDLASQGIRFLCIPTMDLEDWGAHQHELSRRLGITRSVEYGIPVIRIASSGYSVITNGSGQSLAGGSYPGQGEVVAASVPLAGPARRPLDRWPAEIAVWFAMTVTAASMVDSFRTHRRRHRC